MKFCFAVLAILLVRVQNEEKNKIYLIETASNGNMTEFSKPAKYLVEVEESQKEGLSGERTPAMERSPAEDWKRIINAKGSSYDNKNKERRKGRRPRPRPPPRRPRPPPRRPGPPPGRPGPGGGGPPQGGKGDGFNLGELGQDIASGTVVEGAGSLFDKALNGQDGGTNDEYGGT